MRLLPAALLALLVVPPAADARTLQVDCSRGDRLSEVRPAPGDAVLLRRGTVCAGTLVVAADGVRVGAYGEGPRPRIEAAGAEAVLVQDASDVVVEDLALTNPGDGTGKRRGIHLVAATTVVRDVVVRGLHVHDVGGNLDKDDHGSGGIQVSVGGPHHFDGLRIEGNRIEDVSRSGIFIAGTTDPQRPRAGEPWPRASKRVVVRANRIERMAGDGIVTVGTDRALVERNVVRDGNRAGRSPFHPAGMICNAGIWPFHANGTVIRRNVVEDFAFNGCDGTAFDIDYDTDGTLVERNVSRRNAGFLLLCTETRPRTAIVRANLSVDDAAPLQESPCQVNAQGFTGTLDGIRIHNNTFVGPAMRILSPASDQVGLPALVNSGDLEFTNNILVSTRGQLTPMPCGDRCSHNLFHGLPPSGDAAVTGDPRFGPGFRVLPGSPAIGAGADAGPFTDRFGAPATSPPSIGAHQPPLPREGAAGRSGR
jgi:hypothetical protein